MSHLQRFLSLTGHANYNDLHNWSVSHAPEFWQTFRKFADLPLEDEPFNFAEVLLRKVPEVAIIFHDESGTRLTWSRNELIAAVSHYATILRQHNIAPGDRVVAVLPNRPETIALMLAVASRGAIFSSCSPDFGAPGIIDRFAQLAPRLLFTTGSYTFGDKTFHLPERTAQVLAAIPSIETAYAIEDINLTAPAEPLDLPRFPHRHPLFILFSSGTTGLPKCIVHSAGGTLVQIVKEHLLHVDLQPGEKLFYYTTCGWMMWNWLAVGLASAATLVLYHGSPMYPDPGILWRIAEQESIEHVGLSAKYLALLEKSGFTPVGHPRLRQILSTGSPLAPESFDYVWRIKPDVHLASISGGTDIISCFVLGNPLAPVTRGEIQVPGLGMDVQVWSPTGERLWDEPGELVCANTFPSTPLGFWNDTDGTRFRATYFERFPGVWCHGDWAEQSSETGGFKIYGRSDTTLNPGGIRIGTAEIYRIVESIPEVEESVAVAQQWQSDVRIILFVKMRPNHHLTSEIAAQIRTALKLQASPHHVPRKILEVPAIPRTISNKISESAIRATIHNQPVPNTTALANPESLQHFQNLPDLLTD